MSTKLSAKITEEKKISAGAELLYALRCRIKFHQALGIDEYPATADLDQFLKRGDRKTGTLPAAKTAIRQGESSSIPGEDSRQDEEKIVHLRQEIQSCTRCHLYQNRLGCVAGSGKHTSTLMVVGDWSQQARVFSQKLLFGPEEDVMLWKMMEAIKLDPTIVYVTNCLKCCPADGILPDRASEKTCFSFLEREIALVRPQIICAMGEIATRQLTGSSEPLARVRGKFTKYRYQSEREIVVIPTYHPRFLLQNKEMKRATWLDLQAVEKRLRLR